MVANTIQKISGFTNHTWAGGGGGGGAWKIQSYHISVSGSVCVQRKEVVIWWKCYYDCVTVKLGSSADTAMH